MRIKWTEEALADLVRLGHFVARSNPRAASRIIRDLSSAPRRRLPDHPRIGQRVESSEDREIRRLIERDHVIHYEIVGQIIYILRVWHGRERREQQ